MTSGLLAAAGHWVGMNGFRLMPTEGLANHPATALVTIAAGGNVTSFAYTWSHPDDGLQDGVLVFGRSGDDEDSLFGLWGDSWHQQPALMSMPGRRTGAATVVFTGEYGGGWIWRIVIDASAAGALTMRMENIVPEEHGTAELPAGPYLTMTTALLRAQGPVPNTL